MEFAKIPYGPPVKWFAELVKELYPNTAERDIAQIEDEVRHTIFHSTLDWQTREQLVAAIQEVHGWMEKCKDCYGTGEVLDTNYNYVPCPTCKHKHER